MQPRTNGDADVYVAIISADGTTPIAATFVGGSSTDGGEGVAVASNGDIVFGGGTTSSDLPATAGAFLTTLAGDRDGLIGRLSPDLSTLALLSNYGAADRDEDRTTEASPNGDVVVAGWTNSPAFPPWGHDIEGLGANRSVVLRPASN